MAGMFYSLQETAEKLNMTAEQVKKLVSEGRLREFRDGSNVLFKVDEVEVLMSDTSTVASKETLPGAEQGTGGDEISLEPETTEDVAAASELGDADTAVAAHGISVLGETDSEYQLTDDTLSETKKGTTGGASLEEIEENVNLDTFGSGSGLLDLSLQADDTSLGGILDEIYSPEGGEVQEAGEAAPAAELAAEPEQMLPEEEIAGPQPAPEALPIAQAYIEPEPDMISNAFGIMLFLPLLAVVYTAIVAVTGFSDVTPAILEKIQGMIWYVVVGIAVAAILIVGLAFMLGGKTGKVAKKQKTKKAKKTKQAEETPPAAPEDQTD